MFFHSLAGSGDTLNMTTGLVQDSAVSGGFLRRSAVEIPAVLYEDLHLRNAVRPWETENLPICEKKREFGSIRPI